MATALDDTSAPADSAASALQKPTGRLAHRYQSNLYGAGYSSAMGDQASSDRLNQILERQRTRHPGMDFSGYKTPDWQDPNQWTTANASQAINSLTRLRTPSFQQSPNYDVARNHYQNQAWSDFAGKVQGDEQSSLNKELDPVEQANNEMLSTSAFSGQDEMAMRSSLAAQVRAAESQRMNRLASGLGLGNTINSPASAALAEDSAESADSTITSTMRDLGLQVNEMNRTAKAADINRASQIVALRHSIATGSPSTLSTMGTNVAAMIDALYSRDQTMRLMEKQIHDAGKTNLAGRIGEWTSTAGSGLTLGLLGSKAYGSMGGGGGGGTSTPSSYGTTQSGTNFLNTAEALA